jgi:hypothetical protein
MSSLCSDLRAYMRVRKYLSYVPCVAPQILLALSVLGDQRRLSDDHPSLLAALAGSKELGID